MRLKRASLLLLLPLVVAACDSNQPSYSASNANSAPPPPPPTAAPAPPPAPVVETPPPVAPASTPAAEPARAPAPKPFDSKSRFAQVPAGKLGPVDKFNVGSCDDYVERYRACFNSGKIPHESKFPLRRAFAVQVRDWKKEVAAGHISQVAAACTEADRKARVELSRFSCGY